MLGRKSRKKQRNWGKLVLLAGASALAVYLLDPRMGKTRRAKLQDRFGSMMRRGGREASRKTEYAKSRLEGVRHVASSDSPPPNDQALKDKVESEILSRRKYPKGQINVNAQGGIVELRGVAESEEQISQIEQEVRKVTGVVDVHNYLHLH
jgi:osmotically-inducible protein OsmY